MEVRDTRIRERNARGDPHSASPVVLASPFGLLERNVQVEVGGVVLLAVDDLDRDLVA